MMIFLLIALQGLILALACVLFIQLCQAQEETLAGLKKEEVQPCGLSYAECSAIVRRVMKQDKERFKRRRKWKIY